MNVKVVRSAVILVLVAFAAGCASQQRAVRSSAVEYLYSGGYEGQPASVIRLQTPVRVGIAFAPQSGGYRDGFPEEKKQQLLKEIADTFRTRPQIAAIEIIPSTYLNPKGGFDELDRLRAAFRVNEVVLISYDQVQFSDTGSMGLTYWVTYGAGAYVIKGEKNETRTFLDAVVYDIPSRAMLFHAIGQSSLKGTSTLMGVDNALRERSKGGFDAAVADLIVNLDTSLANFAATVKDGLVQVEPTPKLPPWTPSATGTSADGGVSRGGG